MWISIRIDNVMLGGNNLMNSNNGVCILFALPFFWTFSSYHSFATCVYCACVFVFGKSIDIVCWLFGTIFWLYVPQTLCCTASVNNDIRQSHIIGTWHRYARAADHTRAHTLLGEREWTNGMKWNKKDVSFALACIFNLYRCRSSFYSWQTIGLFFLQRKHAGCVFVFFLIHQFIPSVPNHSVPSLSLSHPTNWSDFCELDNSQRLTDYTQTKLITLNFEHAIEYHTLRMGTFYPIRRVW